MKREEMAMEKVFEAINGVFSFIGPLSDFLWEFPTNFDWYSSIDSGKYILCDHTTSWVRIFSVSGSVLCR